MKKVLFTLFTFVLTLSCMASPISEDKDSSDFETSSTAGMNLQLKMGTKK